MDNGLIENLLMLNFLNFITKQCLYKKMPLFGNTYEEFSIQGWRSFLHAIYSKMVQKNIYTYTQTYTYIDRYTDR